MAVQWEKGLPILGGKSLLSDIPDYTKILAEAIVPVGLVAPWGGANNSAPAGWLPCNGDSFAGKGYTRLEQVLGRDTTPDLKGKVVVSVDENVTIFNDRHKSDGSRDAIIPNHTHEGSVHIGAHNHTEIYSDGNGRTTLATDFLGSGINIHHLPVSHVNVGPGGVYRTNDADLGSKSFTTNKPTDGKSITDANLQPYYVLQYIIKHDYV